FIPVSRSFHTLPLNTSRSKPDSVPLSCSSYFAIKSFMAFPLRSEFCFGTTNILRQVKRHCFLWLRLCCSAGQAVSPALQSARSQFFISLVSYGDDAHHVQQGRPVCGDRIRNHFSHVLHLTQQRDTKSKRKKPALRQSPQRGCGRALHSDQRQGHG